MTEPLITQTARERIRAAISAVEGLTGYVSEPKNKNAGTAWPVLREVARDGTYVSPYTRAYDVFAILPATNAEASADAAETLAVPLIEALEEIGTWTPPLELVEVALGNNNSLPALRIRITPDNEGVMTS